MIVHVRGELVGIEACSPFDRLCKHLTGSVAEGCHTDIKRVSLFAHRGGAIAIEQVGHTRKIDYRTGGKILRDDDAVKQPAKGDRIERTGAKRPFARSCLSPQIYERALGTVIRLPVPVKFSFVFTGSAGIWLVDASVTALVRNGTKSADEMIE
jgi:hypothetical protein